MDLTDGHLQNDVRGFVVAFGTELVLICVENTFHDLTEVCLTMLEEFIFVQVMTETIFHLLFDPKN